MLLVNPSPHTAIILAVEINQKLKRLWLVAGVIQNAPGFATSAAMVSSVSQGYHSYH